MSDIKYRFMEVDKEGAPIKKMPSRTLSGGLFQIGSEVLKSDGINYTVVRAVLDMEEFGKEEMHIELLKNEKQL